MTGRTAGSDRTMVVATVEMRWRTFWIALIALAPGAALAGFFFIFLKEWALLWIPLCEFAAFYLIERRSSDGLRLRTYQALNDRRKSDVGTFYLCGQPIDPSHHEFSVIRRISMDVEREAAPTDRDPFEDLR